MIWVVTDNPATADGLPTLIAARGYDVRVLLCHGDVLRHVRFRSPALFIVDCGTTVGNSGVVSAVRAEARDRDVPIVIFAAADDAGRAEALLKGADAVVRKGPLDWADLLGEIRRLAGPPDEANRL